jgi:hypothetical protein
VRSVRRPSARRRRCPDADEKRAEEAADDDPRFVKTAFTTFNQHFLREGSPTPGPSPIPQMGDAGPETADLDAL